MAHPIIQTSFNAGEWAPSLYARVDLQKYHAGASLIRNFFVDYRGGVTTRPGTRYINTAKSNSVRLIPFQASFNVTYVIEMTPGAMRFYNNGAPVLEPATSITAAGPTSPTTWNPADKNASITLSGGNLIATAGTSSDMAVRATQSFASSGKYYFEVTVGSTYAGGDTAIGVMSGAAPRDTFGVNCTGGIGVFPAGNIYYNGAVTGSAIGALATGSVVGVAIDLTNNQAWMRKDAGQWNGSGAANPATNVGGVSIATVFGGGAQAFPVQSFNSSGSFSTANFGSTSFVNGPPSGFVAWLPPAGGSFIFTDAGHGYSNGDWINVGGNYYIVQGATTNTFTLTDLQGNPITFNPFSLPSPAQRVYTLLNSPYLASDLAGVKYVQDVNLLILCHPNYPPYVLTLNAATNWTLAPINFVPTIASPVASIATTGGGSNIVNYLVTAVDINGQESAPSNVVSVNTATGGSTQTVSWAAITGAVSYNIYRTIFTVTAIGSGQPYGYVGTATGTSFQDTGNINANFAITSPVVQNPFAGAGVASLTLNSGGSGWTSVPAVTFTGGSPTIPAAGYCYLAASSASMVYQGSWPSTSNPLGLALSLGNGVVVTITGTTVDGFSHWVVTSYVLSNGGTLTHGAVPTNPVSSTGSLPAFAFPTFNLTWTVSQIFMSSPGAGFSGAPTVGFSGGGGSGASATATLGTSSSGNPSVPALVQQRLFLGGPVKSPSQFNMSQPGAPFNFNTNFPLQPDSAIQETLTNNVLNSIKSAVTVSAGLIIFTDKGAWLLNGGSPGAPISAIEISANPQSYSGASDIPPIVTSQDLLYIQAKNSIVRDLAYNFYLNNYVGMDISLLSSHLFYGYSAVQWAWVEEPFKLVWLVRNDGILLSLTFVKDQEVVAWAHSDTLGSFTSVASVNEQTIVGNVDAAYFAVQRSINGQTVTYIERMVELYYPNDYKSSWQVDAGIGYTGAPATTFSGAQHLAGAAVTGVADGAVINFTMPVSGTFVFGPGGTPGLTGIANASIVTVGLPFVAQLQTLPLDLGEPTVQGSMKKIPRVTVRARQSLGLSIGGSSSTLVAMKDQILGNVGSATNTAVTGLVTADTRTIVEPNWTVPGQYFIQQSNPYPATILGVIPEVVVGDSVGNRK